MPTDEKSLKFLTKLRSVLEDDALTNADFLKAFDGVLKFAEALKSSNQKEFQELRKSIAELSREVRSDTANEAAEMKRMVSELCAAEIGRLNKQHEEKSVAIDARMATVLNGKDADEEKIVEDVLARIKLPEQKENIVDGPDEIRNKLELLQGDERLDKSAIKGLEELEKEITELASRPVGKGGGGLSHAALQLALSKLIKHQAFSTSSATTALTLANKVAGDVVIWVRYQGQMLQYGSQFTVSGTTVALTFTPDDDTTMDVTYLAS
ncbi:MAG: hypothetical protein KBD16_00830 [Candidatus Pacebacteria bacterium]|nr:hypothetical protein [Candidatus Paceibacterota bacterium]